MGRGECAVVDPSCFFVVKEQHTWPRLLDRTNIDPSPTPSLLLRRWIPCPGSSISAPHLHAAGLQVLSPWLCDEVPSDHGGDSGTTAALDVGCGSGYLTVALAAFGRASVVGVDIDPSLIDRARETVAVHYPALSERCSFIEADVVRLMDRGDDGAPGGPEFQLGEKPYFQAVHFGFAFSALPLPLLSRLVRYGGGCCIPIRGFLLRVARVTSDHEQRQEQHPPLPEAHGCCVGRSLVAPTSGAVRQDQSGKHGGSGGGGGGGGGCVVDVIPSRAVGQHVGLPRCLANAMETLHSVLLRTGIPVILEGRDPKERIFHGRNDTNSVAHCDRATNDADVEDDNDGRGSGRGSSGDGGAGVGGGRASPARRRAQVEPYPMDSGKDPKVPGTLDQDLPTMPWASTAGGSVAMVQEPASRVEPGLLSEWRAQVVFSGVGYAAGKRA